MYTKLATRFHNDPDMREAADIIKACVHCGFCTATCPTYQELSDERDSPRGRIYLIKQLLEDATVTERTRVHLDRCLTCRSCETTCPSGVKYGRLIDIARGHMEESLPRSKVEVLKRKALRSVLPHRNRFVPLVRLGQFFKPVIPGKLGAKIPPKKAHSPWPKNSHARKMLLLESCGQSTASPNTNAATARVLDRLGITLVNVPEAGCCGAVSYHLGAHDEGLDYMRRNIDAWWPAIEAGAEAIVMTASGCGATVKEYGHLLRLDPAYAEKAEKISAMARDLVDILNAEDLSRLTVKSGDDRVAVHVPCSQQHALGLTGDVSALLQRFGFTLCHTKEGHLCCGSAGTYSILQSELSERLLTRKLKALNGDNPSLIVTANIGCQMHLEGGSDKPVLHWIELVDRNITEAGDHVS